MKTLMTTRLVHQRGFTIVELLIVIVVIAILATISIVAFNGIRERSEATRIADAVAKYDRLIKVHISSTGAPPVSVSETGSSGNSVCLGKPSDFPASGNFSNKMCHYGESWPGYATSDDFITKLSDYADGESLPSSAISPVAAGGPELRRGATYSYRGPTTGYPTVGYSIEWFIRGTHTDWCGIGEGYPAFGNTWCYYDYDL